MNARGETKRAGHAADRRGLEVNGESLNLRVLAPCSLHFDRYGLPCRIVEGCVHSAKGARTENAEDDMALAQRVASLQDWRLAFCVLVAFVGFRSRAEVRRRTFCESSIRWPCVRAFRADGADLSVKFVCEDAHCMVFAVGLVIPRQWRGRRVDFPCSCSRAF
jgi:hypothetical protein